MMFRRFCGIVGVSGLSLIALRRPMACQPEATTNLKRRKLQLHFDINKTLIVSDPAGGKDTFKMVNSLLSEVIWGRVDARNEWTIISRAPSATSPVLDDPSVMTFGEFLENLKFKHEKATTEEIKKSNTNKKQQATKLKTTFTEIGQIGEGSRTHYDDVMSHLALPQEIKTQVDPHMFKNGQYFVLPAFFNLIVYLQKENRDFSLTFRSFGTEIAEVAAEHNLFCNGQHPLFPNARADGTQGTRDLRIDVKNQIGCFFVSAEESLGTSLTLGSLKPGEGHSEIVGFHEIYKFFNERVSGTWGIRDFYPWWQSHQESETSGKLLLVDVEDTSVLPVFFDDNIERDRAHIVNVRNARTGAPIPFAKAQKHLVKSEPYLAITDPDYFIKALIQCEKIA